jgi:hypothetical protein
VAGEPLNRHVTRRLRYGAATITRATRRDQADCRSSTWLPSGIAEDRHIRVSNRYVAKREAGKAVDTLVDKPLLISRPQQPTVDITHISGTVTRFSKDNSLRSLQHSKLR